MMKYLWLMEGVLMVPLLAMNSFAAGARLEKATFAGGCFWCMVAPFEQLDGVTAVVSGYTGGQTPNPTYEAVSSGATGHLEAVQITFDPARVSYEKLLDVFWRQIDPTDADGQFADRGTSYRTAIYYHGDAQRGLAEGSKKGLAASGRFKKPIVTAILPASAFYPAEDYHQDYWKKNPARYHRYREGSGRERFLVKTWKTDTAPLQSAATYSKPPEPQLKKRLSDMQYKVTQSCGTEPPFKNEYWNNHREGIYVDIVSGEPLFSSRDKFDSGTGWPSFMQPIEPANVVTKEDREHGMVRTEVRSKHADSHLGHVFNDGPKPGGMRYCINSAALRFIPREDLEKEGYGQYQRLFDNGRQK